MNKSINLKSSQRELKYAVYVAVFCTVQIVFMLVPFLGFIPIGPINATTLHLPVISAGILLGKKAGAILGLLFGLISMTRATLAPGITSFLFSPFAPAIGGYSGNLFSLVIALLPRILLGMSSAILYDFLRRKNLKYASSGLTALLATLMHTTLVLGGIFIFFGDAYTSVLSISEGYLFAFIMGIVLTNGLIEAILAVFVVTALIRVLEPMMKLNDSKGHKKQV